MADIAKLSVEREEYYTRELATDHETYLSGYGECPGRWYGAGASSLGLQGEASVAGFQAIFEGCHPTTGELLGRPHGRNAVPVLARKSPPRVTSCGDVPAPRRFLTCAMSTATPYGYELRVVGHLDCHWRSRFGDLELTHHDDGTSTLAGPVAAVSEATG